MVTPNGATTVLDVLIDSWVAIAGKADGVAAPVAIVWPDGNRQWEGVWPLLADAGVAAYRLGAYDPAARTGPAIWLRTVVEAPPATDGPVACPVIYLPGVSRSSLRAGPECPPAVQPLVELLYRGVAWHHRNGNDWTIEAFLVGEAPAGAGLDIAQDRATRDALVRTLPVLAQASLARLRGRRLTAADFDTLHLPDPIVTLLDWLDRGDAVRAALAPEVWESFRSRCRGAFACDPERDNPATLASRLTDPSHIWDAVWQRFVVAPRRYPGIVAHLEALGRGEDTVFAVLFFNLQDVREILFHRRKPQ